MTADTTNGSDEQTYERAIDLMREGRVDEGLAILHELSDRMPKVLGDIAYAHRSRRENEKAMAVLERYIATFPDDPGAWSMMARIAREANDLEQAAGHARRAASAQPENPELHFQLGEILFHQGDHKGAAQAYRRCLTIDPEFNRAQARFALVRHLVRSERFRTIRWRPRFLWLRHWILSRRIIGDLIESALGIPLDDRRWQAPMNAASAAAYTGPAPEGQEPERFAGHFERCECSFWRWFCGLALEEPVRTALDLSVGPGHLAHHFASHGLKVRSLTPSEFARRDRERRGMIARKGDFHMVGERGASFDLLLAAHTLQHSRSPLFALWEWKRLLRPDGYLFVMARLPLDRPAPGTEVGGGGTETGDQRQEVEEDVGTGKREAGQEREGRRPPAERDPGAQSRIQKAIRAVSDPKSKIESFRYAYGGGPHIIMLTYWQLRWAFKQTGFLLVAETLEDPECGTLESVEHVDGRRVPDPGKAWNAFFVLRKPGRLPFDGAIEKPRPLAPELRVEFPPPHGQP